MPGMISLFAAPVAGKLVGDHDTGRPHLPLQQFAQPPLGRVLAASALTKTSSTMPVWSTARPKANAFTPAFCSHETSSRCTKCANPKATDRGQNLLGQKHWLWRAVDHTGIGSTSWSNADAASTRPSGGCANC